MRVSTWLRSWLRSTAVAARPRDYVSDGGRHGVVNNGTPLLRYITSAGRVASSVIASFMAVNRDFPAASVEGLVAFEIVAEKEASGSVALKLHLID
jgi:hydroxyethylthiazole kinase